MSEQDSIGAYAAKTHLPEYLRQVQAGRRFIITQRGKPIAELIPSGSLTRQNAVEAARRMRDLMRRHPLSTGSVNIRMLLDEGRD
jgi:prevent-host-death family protein